MSSRSMIILLDAGAQYINIHFHSYRIERVTSPEAVLVSSYTIGYIHGALK